MLKSLKGFLNYILDTVLPPRSNFAIVQKLNEEKINNLPKADPVEAMDFIHPLFYYKNKTVRAIVWELKYRENSFPLEFIGKLIFEEILAEISDIKIFDNDAAFLLIPIPISRLRRQERRYNQSEYIAKEILPYDLDHLLTYAPQWLEKIKETDRQSHSQSKKDRMTNLHDSFLADTRVQGKYVILIDDVVTTGSTLNEAKRSLLDKGAKDVLAWTLAH